MYNPIPYNGLLRKLILVIRFATEGDKVIFLNKSEELRAIYNKIVEVGIRNGFVHNGTAVFL